MATVQSPQGSRAGLITALVIFVILFVTSLIFAIYFRVEMQKTDENLVNTNKRYAEIISVTDLQNSEVDKLRVAAKDDPAFQGKGLKAINVALAQRDAVARLIAPGDSSQSTGAASTALNNAANTLKGIQPPIVQPTDTLTAAIGNLANAITAREGEISDLKKQVEVAKKSATDAIARAQGQVDSAVKTTEEVRVQAGNTLNDAQSDRTKKQSQIDEIEAARKSERDKSADEITKTTQLVAGKQREVDDLKKQIEKMIAQRASSRQEVSGPIIRAVDGNVVRIAGNGIVYINLGAGDQVSPGLTFQVYDKGEGVPAMGDGISEENMPVGKGSVEVIRVGSTSSECRVLKVTPGTVFSEGDLLVNLVYDKNTRYQFVVHGNFDLNQTGRANPADAEVIKRLITQWGGRLVDQITIDTDFVVLGKEPAVPSFSAEELNDPNKLKIRDDAQAALETYNDLRQKARDLHIPVMNQNRFLYYVGYYDQARR